MDFEGCGISQDKLSKLAEITFHTVSKIESGATSDPRIKTVKKIANALGVGVEELFKRGIEIKKE